MYSSSPDLSLLSLLMPEEQPDGRYLPGLVLTPSMAALLYSYSWCWNLPDCWGSGIHGRVFNAFHAVGVEEVVQTDQVRLPLSIGAIKVISINFSMFDWGSKSGGPPASLSNHVTCVSVWLITGIRTPSRWGKGRWGLWQGLQPSPEYDPGWNCTPRLFVHRVIGHSEPRWKMIPSHNGSQWAHPVLREANDW